MADQEDEYLRMALRMSMKQHSLPEPKRSKPRDFPIGAPTDSMDEPSEVKTRRRQTELMAAAAEKRMLASKSAATSADVVIRSPEGIERGKCEFGDGAVCKGSVPVVVNGVWV